MRGWLQVVTYGRCRVFAPWGPHTRSIGGLSTCLSSTGPQVSIGVQELRTRSRIRLAYAVPRQMRLCSPPKAALPQRASLHPQVHRNRQPERARGTLALCPQMMKCGAQQICLAPDPAKLYTCILRGFQSRAPVGTQRPCRLVRVDGQSWHRSGTQHVELNLQAASISAPGCYPVAR